MAKKRKKASSGRKALLLEALDDLDKELTKLRKKKREYV